MYKLIIFDVDGTLVTTKSGKEFRQGAEDWQWLPARREKLAELKKKGMQLAIATNQGGVAFGYLNEHELRRELRKMAQEGKFDFMRVCVTHPKATIEQYKKDEILRKPGPGMIIEITEESLCSRDETLFIGDRQEDKDAAKAACVDFMWAEQFFSKIRITYHSEGHVSVEADDDVKADTVIAFLLEQGQPKLAKQLQRSVDLVRRVNSIGISDDPFFEPS